MTPNPSPYQNRNLPVEERVDDLLARMTLEEKIAQLSCIMWNPHLTDDRQERAICHGIGQISTILFGKLDGPSSCAQLIHRIQLLSVAQTRLGIPALFHGEALSGAMLPGATSFPLAIGLGATWKPDRLQEMSEVVKKQFRSLGIRHALSPVLDVGRDPRWGRIGETFGEDPTLISALGAAYVNGLQGQQLEEGVAACAKHFLGYSVTEGALNMTEEQIPPRTLREVYAKPFEAVIRKADIASVMNSYSTLDGEPIIASEAVLTDLLRGELGFKGLTVSDYRSIDKLVTSFRTAKDMKDAGIQAIKAGMDMELPHINGYGTHLLEAIQAGEVDLSYVERSVRRVLELKFRLGLFENPYPEAERIEAVFHQPVDDQLSLAIARESVVLVKNEDDLLPLSPSLRKVAVIGPNANSLRNMFGGYSHPASKELFFGMAKMVGVEVSESAQLPYEDQLHALETEYLPKMYPHLSTLYHELQSRLQHAEVSYSQGCELDGSDRSGFEKAVRLASQADMVIMAVGGKDGFGKPCTTGEGNDSSQIGLSGVQEDLVKAVHASGTPVVLVHMSARPLSSPWISAHVPAILEAWHPGQEGGRAIADILLGDYNPGGKLPVSVARSAGQVPVYYAHRNGSGYEGRGVDLFVSKEGYVNESLEPLYPFGHGLSYTQFSYSEFELSHTQVSPDGEIEVSCTITNTGSRAGDEVVQLYMRDVIASMARPVKELVGFQRIHLQPGERKRLSFQVSMTQLCFLDRKMQWIIEPGMMSVMIGTSSRELKWEETFEIVGNPTVVGENREFFSQVRIRA
ncbi:glycoside hydrolase family 3 N-terminal domain-containing protein [Paenibacillus puerhi]|uniref:glycoside hydrolase family 3 N-terminal domain-containing protein n=1 Tax=Paenibacillus puerhi TaxID=2692622 RepID=UPI00135B46AD|nr:glycoside hydrolase family 3 N-terminal domain-containing protein [Paenibacillus puerhi]